MNISIVVANELHVHHTFNLCQLMADAAKKRGTGIAKRSPEYLEEKMREGKAIIALDGDKAIGFCYIETWGHNKFVANSGLIVDESYRGVGLAKSIKTRILELSQEKYPNAKVFGITTSLAVMKINSDLGYKPVTFSELTNDEKFWAGCSGCVNVDILQRTERKLCLCTGMLFDPKQPKTEETKIGNWKRFKELLSPLKSSSKLSKSTTKPKTIGRIILTKKKTK